MLVRIADAHLSRIDLVTRQPFRYGIVTVLGLPHVFLEVVAEVDGRRSRGIAAEHLAPKWFAKDPATSPEQDIAQLLDVIRHAVSLALGRTADSPFALWRSLYEDQSGWGAERTLPPLLTHFGVTLVERALLDAVCRDARTPLHALVRGDALGIDLGALYLPLRGARPADFLPDAPLPAVTARHTVGLVDPLTDDEAADLPEDGLPRSLVASIRTYGLRHFKIKVGGDPGSDACRVERILDLVGAHAPEPWRYTLDGNESYRDADALRALWEPIARRADARRLLFIEQPLHRDRTFADDSLLRWKERPSLIVDEADGALGDLERALALGYAGASHKGCKGVFKGIGNACRLRQVGGRLSGEDLSTVGPVALPADLAVHALLGIDSVERNGHHYFRGLTGFPTSLQQAAYAAHPDLYTAHPFPSLRIDRGAISLDSVNRAPSGVAFLPDLSEIPTCE